MGSIGRSIDYAEVLFIFTGLLFKAKLRIRSECGLLKHSKLRHRLHNLGYHNPQNKIFACIYVSLHSLFLVTLKASK